MELKQEEFSGRGRGDYEVPTVICQWVNKNKIKVISISYDFNCLRWVVFYIQ